MNNAVLFLIIFFLGLSPLLAKQGYAEPIDEEHARTGTVAEGSSSKKIGYQVKVSYPKSDLEPDVELKSSNTAEIQEQLRQLLLTVSESQRLLDKLPASQLILQRRAQADISQLNQALRSRGYYGATINYQIDKTVSPQVINFLVQLGSLYQIDKVEITTPAEFTAQDRLSLPKAEELQIAIDSPADARNIIRAEEKLIVNLKQQAFAYAQVSSKKILVNHQKKTMSVHFKLNPGPVVRLKKAEFNGVEAIDLPFLESLIPWLNDGLRDGLANNSQKTTLYHPDLLETAAQKLIETDLFSTVRVELPGENNPAERKQLLAKHSGQELGSNIQVTLKERKHRTIKTRAAFETDTGIALSAKWTHRNLFGAGEKLSVEAAWTGVGPLLEARFRKPHFLRAGQAFVADLGLKNEDTDAYESSSLTLSAGVERSLRPGMDLTLGLGFRFSEITDKSLDEDNTAAVDSSENYSLVYVPVKFSWDYSNDLFDPDAGGKVLLQGAPFVDMRSDLRFGKIIGRYIQYYKALEHPRLVLAGRLVVGGISGAESKQIPADERFYAGGGGSIRGYGYQLASPLDKNGDPQGGNALIEFAFETRLGFGNNMGAVAFLDGGAAYTETLFDQSNDLRYGAGLGFRYSSPIGPLRADIAMPVDPRDDIDDAYQLYLSIGHAF